MEKGDSSITVAGYGRGCGGAWVSQTAAAEIKQSMLPQSS